MKKYITGIGSEREQRFFSRQIEKDDRANEKMLKAKSAKEFQRIERAWRKEEARDRHNFEMNR